MGGVLPLRNSPRKFNAVDHYVRQRLAKLASVKHGLSGWNWTTRFTYAWSTNLGIYRLRERCATGARMPTVNGVGEPGAGEPHARFDRGLLGRRRPWRAGRTRPETGDAGPADLPADAEPVAYLTRDPIAFLAPFSAITYSDP